MCNDRPGTLLASRLGVESFGADLSDLLLGGGRLDLKLHSREDEYIVALRAAVLDDAEHELGNLFQRMYHMTRVARDGLGPYADRMADTLGRLERLLQLVFDYVSPVRANARVIDAPRVVQSLVQHLRERTEVDVEEPEVPPVRIVGDARLLGQSFRLIAAAWAAELAVASEVGVACLPGRSGGRAELTVALQPVPSGVRPAEAVLAWEIAARLIELQGGDLRCRSESRELVGTIALPRAEASGAVD